MPTLLGTGQYRPTKYATSLLYYLPLLSFELPNDTLQGVSGYMPCSNYQTTEQGLKLDYFISKVHALKLSRCNAAKGELNLSKRST